MHTPTGRGPQAPDVGAKLKALQRHIEHVDRKVSGIKPPAPSGGSIGMTRVTVTSWTSALGTDGWTSQTIAGLTVDTSVTTLGKAPVIGVDTDNIVVYAQDAGWYTIRPHVLLKFSGTAPAVLRVSVVTKTQVFESTWPTYTESGTTYADVDWSTGPIPIEAHDPGFNGDMWIELDYPGSATISTAGVGTGAPEAWFDVIRTD